MNQKLISILMPVKNALPYLYDCVHSIINQQYQNWELIAVNDQSTDDSFWVLNEFAKKDSRIKSINSKKHGIIEALRLAYKFSSGTLITRMDADDMMTSDKLEVLSSNILSRGRGHIAIGQVKYFSAETLGEGYSAYEKWLNELTSSGYNYIDIYKECVVPSPCWMVFREDLDSCNAFNSDWYPEDYDLCFRFYANGLRCIPCDKKIHLWRDHDERTSRTHVNYADNQFTKLKCHYFIQLNRDPERPLILWGAGKRGKAIAKTLTELKVNFKWACNNSNKIGHIIYGQTLISYEEINNYQKFQIIIAVSNGLEQSSILNFLQENKLQPMKDYYCFC